MYKTGGGQLLTNRRAFTLIELLAVIVILAIIALIAVPIILNIIEDAREESNERSVELYASAIKNAIASHQLRTGNEVTPGTYGETNPLPFTVDYEGNVECTITEIYADGNIYLEGCTVNGGEETHTYGTKQEGNTGGNGGSGYKQVYKPQYYSWLYGSIGEDLPSDATTNSSEFYTIGHQMCLGLDVDSNNKITAAYVCFKRNNTEYCLKGYDTASFATNTDIIKDAYADVIDTGNFNFGVDVSISYNVDGLRVEAHSDGNVAVDDSIENCYVSGYNMFECR